MGIGNQALPELTETEIRFLLAYTGTEPKHAGPRSAAKAYLCLNPDASPFSAHMQGKLLLSRLKSKGLLTLILEAQGAGISIATDVLRAGLRAEVIKRIEYPGGIWDYASVPDHRTRHSFARTLLELHNVLSPEGSNSADAFRMTFAEAVAQQNEKAAADRKNALEAEDANYTEVPTGEQ